MVKSTLIARIDGEAFPNFPCSCTSQLTGAQGSCSLPRWTTNLYDFSKVPGQEYIPAYKIKSEAELSDPKSKAKMIIKKLNKNSEPQASIECTKHTIQYVSISFLPTPSTPLSPPPLPPLLHQLTNLHPATPSPTASASSPSATSLTRASWPSPTCPTSPPSSPPPTLRRSTSRRSAGPTPLSSSTPSSSAPRRPTRTRAPPPTWTGLTTSCATLPRS